MIGTLGAETMKGTFVISCLVVFVLLIKETRSDDTIASLGTIVTSSESLTTQLPSLVGKSFLLREINTTSVLFAVSAYFVAQTNLSFQVWRPLGNVDDRGFRRFKLIWQITVTPSVNYFREDIYMEAKFAPSCALVRPGDWFGMLSLADPFSIGAKFVPMVVPRIDDSSSGTNQVVGMEANFEMTFPYPYEFQAACYLLTDLRQIAEANMSTAETVPCPTRLVVPSWISTIPMVTFAPGATGASGATGPRGPNGTIGTTGQKGQPGQVGNFGRVGSPGYTGAMGSTGPAGQMGLRGPMGEKGQRGQPGSLGVVGDAGQPGSEGPPGNNTYQNIILADPLSYQSTDGGSMSDGGLADRTDLRMGAIIWLSILSALVILCSVVLLFVCYFVADDRRIQKNETAWIETESKRRF